MNTNLEMKGVAGWLAFFVLALCVLGPIFELTFIYLDFARAEEQNPELVNLPVWLELQRNSYVIEAVTIALRWAAGIMLLKVHKPKSVHIAAGALIAAPIISYFGNHLSMISLLGEDIATAASAQLQSGFFRGLIVAGFWCAYLYRSIRVRNTYFY